MGIENKNRTSSTIPFDYVQTVGPAKASRWLTTASGRRISNPGLTKRMNRGLYL